MSGGVPYIRFFGDDWLSGTQELSLEERGALITLVALTAASGKNPRADYARLARRFGTTRGKAKTIITSLIALRKIELIDGYLLNERAVSELRKAQEFCQKQSERSRGRSAKSVQKPLGIKDETLPGPFSGAAIQSQNQSQSQSQSQIQNQNDSSSQQGDAMLSRLSACLHHAAGGGVDWSSADIELLSEPLRWISGEQACTLADVEAGVGRVARRRQGAPPITTWNYFTNAVYEARDRRLTPHPDPVPAPLTSFTKRTKHEQRSDNKDPALWRDEERERRREAARRLDARFKGGEPD